MVVMTRSPGLQCTALDAGRKRGKVGAPWVVGDTIFGPIQPRVADCSMIIPVKSFLKPIATPGPNACDADGWLPL